MNALGVKIAARECERNQENVVVSVPDKNCINLENLKEKWDQDVFEINLWRCSVPGQNRPIA